MTPSKEILEYYDSTSYRETRGDLRLAVKLVDDADVDGSREDEIKVAVDCGCGAGSDIAFLRSKGFIVHAFDMERESIARCRKRFGDDKDVLLSQATFTTFKYPRASLIVADASLGSRQKINIPRLRRILAWIQGVARGAWSLYVTLAATKKPGQKTSKMG